MFVHLSRNWLSTMGLSQSTTCSSSLNSRGSEGEIASSSQEGGCGSDSQHPLNIIFPSRQNVKHSVYKVSIVWHSLLPQLFIDWNVDSVVSLLTIISSNSNGNRHEIDTETKFTWCHSHLVFNVWYIMIIAGNCICLNIIKCYCNTSFLNAGMQSKI